MSIVREFQHNPPNEPPVRGFLHLPAHPSGDALVLTHGAGANSNAPLLVALAGAFCDAGFAVLRCDLPFRQSRPHGPPQRGSAERDQRGLKAAVASMLAAGEPGLLNRLLLLSYPLHPPRRPNELRMTHFPRLQTPAMFVLGIRDPFATIEELTAAFKLIPARTELLPIAAAGHELLTRQNLDNLPKQIVEAFRSFADGVPP